MRLFHTQVAKRRSILTAFAACMSGLACTSVAALERPTQVSGVAAVEGGYYVVDDKNGDYYFFCDTSNSNNRCAKKTDWRPQKIRSTTSIGELEAIDVGYGPSGETIWVAVSEKLIENSAAEQACLGATSDHNDGSEACNVRSGRLHYVVNYKSGTNRHQLKTLVLPPMFAEKCLRGAEGVSVRWRGRGWDVAVSSEGGAPDEQYFNMEGCEKDKLNNAYLVVYRVSPDGRIRQIADGPHELKTLDLLKNREEEYRIADIAWCKETEILALLVSTPKQPNLSDPRKHKHKRLQQFVRTGGRWIAGEAQIDLRSDLGSGAKSPNWEGLDTSLDGESLLFVYDKRAKHSPVKIIRLNAFACDQTIQ